MRKIFFLLVIICILVSSCSKDEVTYEARQNDITYENDIEGYYVSDNTMFFNSADSYIRLNDKLSEMKADDILNWENEIGFTSYRTKYHEVLEALDTVESLSSFNSIIENNQDIVSGADGDVFPLITNTSYQRTANASGYFVIAGTLHQVNSEELLIFNGCFDFEDYEQQKSNLQIANSVLLNEPVLLKSGTCDDSQHDETIYGKYKCEVYANLSDTYFSQNGDVFRYYEIDCYTVSKAKGLWWSRYRTLHAHNNFIFTVEIPVQNCTDGCIQYIATPDTLKTDQTSSEVKEKKWYDGHRLGDYVINESIITNPQYVSIHGEFWTRGTWQDPAELNCN